MSPPPPVAAEPPLGRSARRAALGEAGAAFGGATALCALLVRGRGLHPAVAPHVSTIVAAVFLFVPAALAWRRDEELADYGFRLRPLGRSLAIAVAAALLVLPLFTIGYALYHQARCALGWAPPGSCALFLGLSGARLRMPRGLGELALGQLFAVGVPEELFYRGYLQRRLEEAWPPGPGGRGRLAALLSSRAIHAQAALFALTHFAVDGNPARLAVFFPGVVFGWMRAATGSIFAGALFHAGCNLAIATLDRSFFR